MTTDNESRVWLITGSSAGFGRSIARAALGRGDRVVAMARRPETVADLVSEAPDRVRAVALDVTRPEGGREAIAAALERFGRLDVLVNNAGYAYADTVGATRAFINSMDGTQPGDPDKAARAILTALDAADPPLRLALGDDAVDAIGATIDGRRAELTAWESVSRDTVIEVQTS